jgi:Fe-S-cluster containining protein
MIPLNQKEKILSYFTCQKTGNCCRADGVVYASQIELSKMANLFGIDINIFKKKYVKKKNGWSILADRTHRPNCFLTEDNSCKVYSARPEHCQTYPDWPEIWKSENTLQTETQLCPALKKAYTTYKKDPL